MKLQLFLFVKFTPKCALCIRYVQQSLSKTKGPLTFFLIYLNNSHIAAEKKASIEWNCLLGKSSVSEWFQFIIYSYFLKSVSVRKILKQSLHKIMANNGDYLAKHTVANIRKEYDLIEG